MARISARMLTMMASAKNCCLSMFLLAPLVFRTPISRALMEELAVVKFMKLMQATIRTRKATMEKILM